MVEVYGFEWLNETYQAIQNDKRDQYLLLMSMMPLARTAMDKEGGRWQSKYTKDLRNMLFELTPWERQGGSVRSAYRGKVKSGTISVVLDSPQMAKNPLFKGAKVVK